MKRKMTYEERDYFEDRAAIIEEGAKVSRSEAEKRAYREMVAKFRTVTYKAKKP